MLERLGATLSTEAWNPKNKPNMTFSHPWASAPACCIVSGIFGVEPLLPGFEKFAVKFGRSGINRALITVPTVRGEIKAGFDGGVHTLTVPTGCAACVTVKAGKNKRLMINGKKSRAEKKNGVFTFTVKSGEHRFEIY